LRYESISTAKLVEKTCLAFQQPSKGDIIDLVNGLCLIQDRIQAECGFDFMKDPKLSNVEALKVPMFYVWSRLYGHTHTLSPRGTSAYWLASFKTSPPEYLSECMRLLREGEIPYVDMELRNSLINFYSDIAEAYEA
jgi:hypothetical protein